MSPDGATGGVAAFDFDGTLVPGDSLIAFLASLLGRRSFALAGAACAPAMALAYRASGRDGSKAALLARCLAGVPADAARDAGVIYGDRLARRVRPAMADRIGWHRDQGHRLVLVSASLRTYLEPFAAATGFDHVIATTLEEDSSGLLTGRLLGFNVRGAEKASRLGDYLGGQSVELWAYGNSAGDRELLAMADHPTMVRRKLPSRRPA